MTSAAERIQLRLKILSATAPIADVCDESFLTGRMTGLLDALAELEADQLDQVAEDMKSESMLPTTIPASQTHE